LGLRKACYDFAFVAQPERFLANPSATDVEALGV
jgi:hypothetical protein